MTDASSPRPVTDPGDDPLAALMAETGPDVLNRLNADFEDSVLFVGCVLGGLPEATATRVTAIDSRGIDIVVADPTGKHPRRLDFAEPVQDPMELTAALFGLIDRARAESGEEGQTTAERERVEMARIRTFLTRVVSVEEVHPHLRQITFGGGDLMSFEPLGPDTFAYLLLPPPGRRELTIDQSFTWEQHSAMAEAERPVGAYYTMRRWRPAAAEIDMLMVLHDDAGHASAWAARAEPGDPVALWGPRTGYYPPPGTQSLVLVADETGLPAVAAILEQLPAGWRAQVVAEVASEEERQALRSSLDIDVVWCHRDGAAPGTTTLLADGVRTLPSLGPNPYVWGGGESHAMTAVRRYVRDELGLAREAVSLTAYWRHRNSPDPDPEQPRVV
jgi:NADPH-dependent ferric siderophore reductase